MSDESLRMDPQNQFIGDVMILQVLADSEQVNDQEREVLMRWIEAADFPESAAAPVVPAVALPALTDAQMEMLGQIEQEFVTLPDLAAWIRRLQDHLREARAAAQRPALTDEQIKSEAERWHDNDTISDETCEHRALEIIAFAAGARWAAAVAPSLSERLWRAENALRNIEEACNFSPHREAGTWDVSLAALIHQCARLLPPAGVSPETRK